MGVFFYNLFLIFFRAGIYLASAFHPKARKWVRGRKNIMARLREQVEGKGPVVWMHCASLGEFEQGRPLLESIREQYPHYRILLTFFSPSGYEIRKNYTGADWVFYLPMDGPATARRFLEIVQPKLVIFVKYEFWYYYLKKIKYRQIPLVLVSALFLEKMSFFRWYGALSRKMLSRFDQLFVQDAHSQQLLSNIGLGNITRISGDTRFDRVVMIADKAPANPVVEKFAAGRKLIVAGSTWPADEELLKKTLALLPPKEFAAVIAPHEIHASHLQSIEIKFPGILRYSSLVKGDNPENANAPHASLLIDNIGLLSQLYRHAWVCFIGGGFGKGIHNTLEAAVYGKPVFFGPVHHKFREALELKQVQGAFSVRDEQEWGLILQNMLVNPALYTNSAKASGAYVRQRVGATDIIMKYFQEKRLLTN